MPLAISVTEPTIMLLHAE